MLTQEENERLTHVGPGTPIGRLLRWYWHPVAAMAQLRENPVRRVRLLGEDLVLFRDRSGHLGLIGQRCAHRATGLWYGIPDVDGLRCPYHGWKYDASGQCIDQPLEPPGSSFKERITLKAYPVQELGGLIWAYLGEQPAPLLPKWDLFVKANTFRHMGATVLPCNWLQCQENGGDPLHGIFLHGHFYQYVIERRQNQGQDVPREAIEFADSTASGGFREVRCEPWEYGLRKWTRSPELAADQPWREQGVMVFPYIRVPGASASSYQIGVPIDDTHTWHIIYMVYTPRSSVEVPAQDIVPYFDAPFADEQGDPIFDYITAQDHMAWWSQGDVTDRTQEHLGYTDLAVIQYRKLLEEQIAIVEQGGVPMNVFRDPAGNEELYTGPARVSWSRPLGDGPTRGSAPRFVNDTAQFSPVYDQLLDLYEKDAAARG